VSRRAKNPTAGWSSSRPERKRQGRQASDRQTSGRQVSRETPAVEIPPPPGGARTVFGEHLPTIEAYAEWLAGAGVVRGLLGPREIERLWDRHLLNCGVLAELVPADSSLCDVGSGAGLPGLVLAVTRPDLEVTLLEPLLRRSDFLSEVVESLGVTNAVVVRARAEAHVGRYDTVTARAVAPLDRLLRVSTGLCKPGGSVLAMKGDRAESELREVEPDLPGRGIARWSVERVGVGVVSPPTTVVRLVRADG
jgi:16S rRNA (guanine527-N7)-methyltransferase